MKALIIVLDRVVTRVQFLLVALAFLAIHNSMQAATITWANTAGGNWSVAANWNPNQVPASADDAVITASGTYLVTMDISPTVNSLTIGGTGGQQTLNTSGNSLTLKSASVVNARGILGLSGGTLGGAGALTINGMLTWTGGSIAGSLTIATNSLLVLAGTQGSDYQMAGALTNAGTIRLESGNLLSVGPSDGGNGMLVNLPGALVDLRGDVSIDNLYSRGGPIINQGAFQKSGGTGTSSINPTFNNAGILDVQSGIVSLNGYYSLANGTLNFGINNLTNYGQIKLPGSASLAGTLAAKFNHGFQPGQGNSFAVLTYGSASGAFANFILPGGIAWQTNYGASVFTLTAAAVGLPILPTHLDFESVNAGNGVDATSYLASYGISLSGLSYPGSVRVFSDTNFYGSGVVTASSGHNFLLQNVGGSPNGISYTMNFSAPLTNLSFTRVAVNVASQVAQWAATAYAGSVVAGSVGEPFFAGTKGSQVYTLSGAGITSLTITANGQNSAGISSAPLDDFYLTPVSPTLVPSSAPTLLSAAYLGVPGTDQRGTALKYFGGSIYVAGNNTASSGFIAGYATPMANGAVPLWNTNWPDQTPSDQFSGMTVSPGGVYVAGPDYTRTTDTAGGKEVKGLVVKFPLSGPTGGGYAGAIWDRQTPAAPGAYSYGGSEGLNAVTLANENGTNYIYATGNGQHDSSNGGRLFISKVAEDSTVLWSQTDGAEQVDESYSAANAVTVLNTNVYTAGRLDVSGVSQGYLRKYSPSGALLWVRSNNLAGQYNGITSIGSTLYAAGYSGTNKSTTANLDFLIEAWDQNGNQLWSRTFDRGGAQDALNAVVSVNGRLFGVGYTRGQTAGGADAILLEIDPSSGNLLSTNLYGGSLDDLANGVDTDGTNLYVIGETRSFGSSGANQAMVLQYSLQPVVSQLTLSAKISAGNSLLLNLTGTPGQTYILQAAASLVTPINWRSVFTNSAEGNGNWSYTNSTIGAKPLLFYRITVP